MPSKVSLLWAICGAVEYALMPTRWILFAVTLAVAWIPSDWVRWLAAFWGVAWLADVAVTKILRRISPDEDWMP